jgi:hypothetical protein
MRDTKERLSVLWIFTLLNYLYADVVALFAIAGTQNSFEPLSPWALMASAVLMEIPIAMILACRLLPFRANRLANIIAGAIVTPCKRVPHLRSASGRMGQAACFSRVLVLRNDRDRGHLGHRVESVDLVTG